VARAAQGKRVVHLATHGFFAGDACQSALIAQGGGDGEALGMNPMLLSGLALAGANDGGMGGGDGIWTAEEIANLSLAGTELVVLSACDTALGTIEAGEGVLGLRRAFSLSGAKTTVMSLWPVDDVATAWLMNSLYEALPGTPAPDALRQAQLALLEHNRAEFGEALPETWAAFIVSGGRW
jgi:CHAT domain-containing protein